MNDQDSLLGDDLVDDAVGTDSALVEAGKVAGQGQVPYLVTVLRKPPYLFQDASTDFSIEILELLTSFGLQSNVVGGG